MRFATLTVFAQMLQKKTARDNSQIDGPSGNKLKASTTESIVKFTYRDTGIRGDESRKMLCLTDMWRADGADPSRNPYQWSRREGKQLIEFLSGKSNTTNSRDEVIRIVRGGTDPGTWAVPKIALAYGMYLSTEFQDKCLGIILSVFEDGGYALPGREQEFVMSLLAKLEQAAITIERGHQREFNLLERINSFYTLNGLVRTDQAAMIRSGINVLAKLTNCDESVSHLVAFRRVDKLLRARLRPTFSSGRWNELPIVRFGEVMSEIARMNAETEAAARSAAKHAAKKDIGRQQTIDFAAAKARRQPREGWR